MSVSDIVEHWKIVIAALAAAWGMRFTMGLEFSWTIESVVGMGSLLALVVLYLRGVNGVDTFWNEALLMFSIIRPHTIEVSAAVLFNSVPQGIDLSHNGSKVLATMNVRFNDQVGGILEFIVCRPLQQGQTRAGFVVKRSQLGFPNSESKLVALSELLTEDIQILESAMRAAYPHTPISRARLQDMLLISSGGVDTLARNA